MHTELVTAAANVFDAVMLTVSPHAMTADDVTAASIVIEPVPGAHAMTDWATPLQVTEPSDDKLLHAAISVAVPPAVVTEPAVFAPVMLAMTAVAVPVAVTVLVVPAPVCRIPINTEFVPLAVIALVDAFDVATTIDPGPVI